MVPVPLLQLRERINYPQLDERNEVSKENEAVTGTYRTATITVTTATAIRLMKLATIAPIPIIPPINAHPFHTT